MILEQFQMSQNPDPRDNLILVKNLRINPLGDLGGVLLLF